MTQAVEEKTKQKGKSKKEEGDRRSDRCSCRYADPRAALWAVESPHEIEPDEDLYKALEALEEMHADGEIDLDWYNLQTAMSNAEPSGGDRE